MILADVQDVNVVRDLWDWVGLVGGVAGGFGAAWAIWVSAQTKQDIIDERRRQFQLDVLREIATSIDNGFLYLIADDPEKLRQFARRLDLLPGADLPTWREMLTMRWPDDVAIYMGFKDQQLAKSQAVAEWVKCQPPPSAPSLDRGTWAKRYEELVDDLQLSVHSYQERVSNQLLGELVHAITVRVEDGAIRSRRRFRFWRR